MDFDSLYREQFDSVRRYVSTFGDDIAEDATQFAFTQLAAGKMPADHEAPGAWLRAVARNEAISLLAQEDRRGLLILDAPVSDGGDAPTPDAIDHTADPALIAEVRESLHLLKCLKPSEAKVLVMLALGWSYKEVAADLDKTYTWVNRNASEGRSHLRQLAEGGE